MIIFSLSVHGGDKIVLLEQKQTEDLSGFELSKDADVTIEQDLGNVLASDLVENVHLPEGVKNRKTINQHRINSNL
ncbi:MAG: hypothetical protein UZ19_OD1000609 [Parcubacteria bacterium OLB19]|nr:MAG: hypothetical protein UZ19_OD1000609 [Parcubacteria bacterium OLB19]